MQPESRFADFNGLRLHYLVWGDEGKPPVVLAHANGFLAALWQPIAERLAERHTVYAFDIRGHGDSDKSTQGYHWATLVDDLHGLLDHLELKSVPIVGHSSGGAQAAYLAATRPEYVARVVAYEPIIVPAEMAMAGGNPMAFAARKRRSTWPSVDEMIAIYKTRPTFAEWDDAVLRLYAEHGTFTNAHGEVQLKCDPEIEAQMFENTSSLDWSVLPQIRCPVLFVAGERTEAFLRAAMESAAGQIPGARTMTLPDAGHLAPMERPESLAELITGFLGEDE